MDRQSPTPSGFGFADDESVVGAQDATEFASETEKEIRPLPNRSLTEIEDEGEMENADENANGHGDDDEEEEEGEEEDEEEQESEGVDKRRRKKRRKRAGNQFLDIEADVDEDEDEEDEDVEEGFVAGTDDFIVNRGPREPTRDGLPPASDEELADYGDGEGDGDASHRLLDRRRMKAKDREAAELAASFHDRYGKARYDTEGMEEWAPKALLMPGVNDPSIWGIRCKIGRERDLVLSLSRKAAALAASDNGAPLQIISAFHRDSIKGYIYVEARSEAHVRSAVNGLIGIYSGAAGGVFLVDIEEMPDLLKTKQKKVEVLPGGWVRIKRGKYAGDLAQIVDLSENGEDVALKFIPRIDLTPKDEGMTVGSDGKKRKKGAATPLAFRPPQRFFNPEEIGKIYGKKEISKRPGNVLVFRNDTYKDGYCEKDIRISGVTLEDVQPTIDELTRFLGDAGSKGLDGEGGAGGLDLSHIAEAARKSAKSILQPGDHVEVFEGDQRGIYGTVESIANDVVIMSPHADLNLEGTKVEVQARSVRKRFRAGDHVKVMQGSNADETGLVVKVKDDVVTFLSDLSLQEVVVFAKDVREAAEVGSGVNVIGQYELHDLVQLDPQTTGVIFKIERDTFRILDQSGTVRSLKPSQIGIKASTRDAIATDQNGEDIRPGDMMKEIGGGNMREGRTGRVLHIYRSMFAFLHNRDVAENGGVFVTYARSLVSTAPKAAAVKASTQLNPELFAKPLPQAQTGMSMRADGRIHRKVSVTRGAHKGYTGVIKDVTGAMARVELHTNSKVITISLESLKEQQSDGTLIPLLERPMGGPSYGGRPGGFSRDSSAVPTSSNSSALGSGRTPFPSYGGRTPAPAWSGGRTPAPQNDGGRTPAMGTSGGSSCDPSGRTPAYQAGGSSAWAPSSRTPAHPSTSGTTDSWNPSSRTPHHPAGATTSSDPWNASSRTPFHQGSSSLRDNDGGRTPDPRAASGNRTPAYGAKSGFGRDDRGEGSSGATMHAAPTPAPTGSGGDWDNWGEPAAASAPTPAATRANEYGNYQAKTPYEAPTPYGAPTPGAGAPTPAPYASHYNDAPTPGFASAATPGAYGPTPGAYGATPAAYGQTPGVYAGAATGAAQSMEYVKRAQQSQGVAGMDWTLPGLRVAFLKGSPFQNGRMNDQTGRIVVSQGGISTVVLDSNGETVSAVPTSTLLPMTPTRAGEQVLILTGDYRAHRATTQSRDGSDWMVSFQSGGHPYKLALARTAFTTSPSPLLASTLRDWILELLLRSRTPKDEQTLLSVEWWVLLSEVAESAGGSTSTPTLPIFVGFVGGVAGETRATDGDAKLVEVALIVARKLIGGGMRKATVDAALEGYAALLKSSVIVLGRKGPEAEAWEELAEVWLKAFRGVVDAGKGGKKIPLHTLANLPSILPLLSLLPNTSELHKSLLLTLQFSLFNVDNLRRGIARESYNAGTSTADKEESDAAEGELFNALRSGLTARPEESSQVFAALPSLFTLYRAALATHAATLFPLPARTSFPTASAYRSATELHALQKRRALAGGWIRGVAALLAWKVDGDPMEVEGQSGSEDEEALCLALTFEDIEKADLYREGAGEGWDGVLEMVVSGAVRRLEATQATIVREALTRLLGAVLRLSFAALESSLPAILACLSSTPSAPSTRSAATSLFLTALLEHHTRSLLLPELLVLLSDALAAPGAVSNNLLTTHEWAAELERALGGMVGMSVKSCWETLVLGVDAEFEKDGPEAVEPTGERSKKRRKVDASSDDSGACARLNVLALFVKAMPTPLPIVLFEAFRSARVDAAIKELAKGRGSPGVGAAMLSVRYAMLERMRVEGAEVGTEWELGTKMQNGLVALVEGGEGSIVIEVARTLLQSLAPSSPSDVAHKILAAIIARLVRPVDDGSLWTGHLQGLDALLVPIALWELVTRRWLGNFDHFGTPAQLAEIAQLVVSCQPFSADFGGPGITLDSITARVLRRADFYELRQLQPHVHSALLAQVTIPSLFPPLDVLAALSAQKPPKALRALTSETLLAAVRNFSRITALFPMEYVGKALRNDLIERAVGLDVWLCGGKVELPESEIAEAQATLGRFIVLAAADGSSISGAPEILTHLVRHTNTTSRDQMTGRITLYKHFVKSAIASYRSEKSIVLLVAYLEAFEKPLADLAKRSKRSVAQYTCEELAFLALCDTLVTSFGDVKSLPDPLVGVIRAVAKSASKPFAKVLSYTTATLGEDPVAIHEVADVLRACRTLWRLKDWISAETGDHEQVDLYASFSETVLSSLVRSLPSNGGDASWDNALQACLAMLDLLSYRIARLRAISDISKVSTLPLETFVACHLTFRRALQSIPGASAVLEDNLKAATSSATIREYTAVLDDISAALAATVSDQPTTPSSDSLESVLEVALVLLRDGPEGSSRLSSACLSDLLRHLSLYLVSRNTSSGGESTARTFLVMAKFLQGVCGDRPMLLSRQSVSTALALVARMFTPSGTPTTAVAASSAVPIDPTSSSLSSELFLSLVSTLDHLVRHRKDHITPLFPQLVATLASVLSVLRRSGFGTTGSSSSEDAEAGVALGRRAEREARATFPFWAWEGGARGMGRKEAKAVGRLLGSLTAKTAATLKRKHGLSGGRDKDASTTSLAAPLSKHAPFIILPYLRACVHAVSPIPSSLRSELQGGWFEILDVMGKWEREALMKGFLSEEEEAERGVLRGMWRAWEKERYRG